MENFDPKEESKGLGDTIAKITNATGLDKLADSVAKLSGKEDCGCGARRTKLNQMFPYKVNTPPPPLPESLIGEIKEGTYLVNKKLVYTHPEEKATTIFQSGDKIYINKNMHIYENLKHYLSNNILTKIEE